MSSAIDFSSNVRPTTWIKSKRYRVIIILFLSVVNTVYRCIQKSKRNNLMKRKLLQEIRRIKNQIQKQKNKKQNIQKWMFEWFMIFFKMWKNPQRRYVCGRNKALERQGEKIIIERKNMKKKKLVEEDEGEWMRKWE